MQDLLRSLKSVFLAALLTSLAVFYAFTSPDLDSRQRQAAAVASPFLFTFNTAGTLNETSNMNESSSPYWWVNSGGRLLISGGFGTTMTGDAPTLDKWRLAYALSNPTDTDNGLHPQNIFRLVSRNSWENARIDASFKILKDNWSRSPNRNASNGLLLMNRYQDSDTLYYAGIRVDGYAVLKKKYDGAYHTMAQKRIYAGEYVQGGKVNVLPHQNWLSLRSETITKDDGSVLVTLYQKGTDGKWKKLLEATDSGQYGGTPPITEGGYFGVRTDFMDVTIDSLRAETIN